MSERRIKKWQTEFGQVTLTPGRNHENGWSLSVGGTCQSYIDLDNPSYMHYIFLLAPALYAEYACRNISDPVIVHIGGGGLAIPRRLCNTLKNSHNTVMEPNTDLVEIVLRELPLDSPSQMKVDAIPGQEGIARLEDHSVDVLLIDAYHGNEMPVDLTTDEFFGHVKRVLKPSGMLVSNIIDSQGLKNSRDYLELVMKFMEHSYVSATIHAHSGKTKFMNAFVIAAQQLLDTEEVQNFTATEGVKNLLVHHDVFLQNELQGSA